MLQSSRLARKPSSSTSIVLPFTVIVPILCPLSECHGRRSSCASVCSNPVGVVSLLVSGRSDRPLVDLHHVHPSVPVHVPLGDARRAVRPPVIAQHGLLVVRLGVQL